MRHLLLSKINKKPIYIFIEIVFGSIFYLDIFKVRAYTIKISREYKNCNQRQWKKSISFKAHTSSKNQYTKNELAQSLERCLCVLLLFLYSKTYGDMCTVIWVKNPPKNTQLTVHISPSSFNTKKKKNTEKPLQRLCY